MRAVKLPEDVQELATTGVEQVSTRPDKGGGVARGGAVQLAEGGFFEDRKFGVYRHGGTVGWLSGLAEYPEVTKLLT